MTSLRSNAVLVIGLLFMAAALAAQIPEGESVPASAGKPFTLSCVLPKAGLTSVGVFDAGGRLVKVLWTMQAKQAGTLNAEWDGTNNQGNRVAPGSYTWKVVLNNSTYKNIGTIGNTGFPPTSSGHVPIYLEGVAVDANNGVYSVHDWDEAHFDIIKWSPKTGFAEFNSGHHTDALLKGIAVEPDGSRAYASGYLDISDRAKAKFGIWSFKLSPERGRSSLVPFSKAGPFILVYDGGAEFPPDATPQDRELMSMPILSLALRGDTLYATDSLGGRVLLYDKNSGVLRSEIKLPMACGLAVDPDGRIWVGHEHGKVSVFDPEGRLLGTPISDLKEVRALARHKDKLFVADRETGEVRVYSVEGSEAKLQRTFGKAGRPGDRASNRFTKIQGIAVDGGGNIIVTDRVGQGSRIQKFSPDFQLLWQQMGLEFSSQGAFGRSNPDLLITANKNAYRLDRKKGGWKLLGPAKTDRDGHYFGNFDSSHFGPPRIVRKGKKDLFYFPAGDGVAVYEIVPGEDASRGPTLKLVSCLAGSLPRPDGASPRESWKPENRFLWSWHDEQGDNEPQSSEITVSASPSAQHWEWMRGSASVDDRGFLSIVSYIRSPPNPREESAIYLIAPRGVNKLGNPIYNWDDAIRIVGDSAGPSALGIGKEVEFTWKLAVKSPEQMIYALANVKKEGLAQNEAMHMGGNVLYGFERKDLEMNIAQPKWCVELPQKSVGLSAIPGGKGGVLLGGDPFRGGIRHYTRDGLLIGGFQSDPRYGVEPLDLPSGLLDAQLAVNCNRDPRDGILDVFTEDNYNQRLIWYRVDDRDIASFEGEWVVQ